MPLRSDSIKLRVTVDEMSSELLHYFTGYEKQIEKMIKEQLTPKRFIEEISRQINNQLTMRVSGAIDKIVADKVVNCKALQNKIETLVEKVVKDELTPPKKGK